MSAESTGVVLLRILTPERAIYDGAVSWVQIPLEDGMLGVWPGHAPLVATVAAGIVTYMEAGVQGQSSVRPGVLLIDGTHCVVLLSDSDAHSAEADLDDVVAKMEAELEDALGDDTFPDILEKTL